MLSLLACHSPGEAQGATIVAFNLTESGNPSRSMGVPYQEARRQEVQTGGIDAYLRTERPAGILYFLLERNRTRMYMELSTRVWRNRIIRADLVREGSSTKQLTVLTTMGRASEWFHADRNPETDILEGTRSPGNQLVRISTHDRVYLNVVEALISDGSLSGTSKRFFTLCFGGKPVSDRDDESLATFWTATIDHRLLGVRNQIIKGLCHNLNMEYGTNQSRPAGVDAYTHQLLVSLPFESRVLCDQNDDPLCYDLDGWGITATPLADSALPIRAYPTETVDPRIVQLLREPLRSKGGAG